MLIYWQKLKWNKNFILKFFLGFTKPNGSTMQKVFLLWLLKAASSLQKKKFYLFKLVISCPLFHISGKDMNKSERRFCTHKKWSKLKTQNSNNIKTKLFRVFRCRYNASIYWQYFSLQNLCGNLARNTQMRHIKPSL